MPGPRRVPSARRGWAWVLRIGVIVIAATGLGVMAGFPLTVLLTALTVAVLVVGRLFIVGDSVKRSYGDTGPGMLADFTDDIRRRPRRSDAWAAEHRANRRD